MYAHMGCIYRIVTKNNARAYEFERKIWIDYISLLMVVRVQQYHLSR